jgi:hypothetical protein
MAAAKHAGMRIAECPARMVMQTCITGLVEDISLAAESSLLQSMCLTIHFVHSSVSKKKEKTVLLAPGSNDPVGECSGHRKHCRLQIPFQT